jgi:hypothetical protein
MLLLPVATLKDLGGRLVANSKKKLLFSFNARFYCFCLLRLFAVLCLVCGKQYGLCMICRIGCRLLVR